MPVGHVFSAGEGPMSASVRLLVGGFVVMLILLGVLGFGAIRVVDDLSDLTTKIYRHPLAVSNAVLEADAAIIAMHRDMKDIAMSRDPAAIDVGAAAIEELGKRVEGRFNLIMERFLGDKSKIERARDDFRQWTEICVEVAELARQGRRDDAIELTRGVGAKQVELMAVRMEGLIDFAREKAAEFLQKSQSEAQRNQDILLVLMALMVVVWSAISFVVVNRIRVTEKALCLAKDDAEKADRAKTELLASMSHDLRTPLNAIMGFSDMIANRIFGPVGDRRYEEYARDIRDSGEYLVSLINDILDLSKIDTGRYEIESMKLELRDILGSTMRMIEPQAREAGIATEIRVAEGTPALWADRRAVIQILTNLLSNAVKFSNPGGTVRADAYVDDDGSLCIRVADDGIGMNPEDIDRALEPFQQINSRLSRKHEGSGLGLYLCHKLAKLHGATLDLRSEAGLGTTVVIAFPRKRIADLRLVG